MTDQSILLIGMMTEGIHTPFLSDRDLALENVRYVLRRGGPPRRELPASARRVHRAAGPAGPWPSRSDLLRRITDEGLLNAIADGTFGITSAPGRRRPRPGRRHQPGRRITSTRPAEFLEGPGPISPNRRRR